MGPVIFARGESATQPVNPASHFEAGIQVVYVFFNFEGLGPEDTVTGTWYRDTDLLFTQNVRLSEVFGTTLPEKGHLWLSIRFEQGALPGSYRLDLSLNQELTESGSFAVDPK